MKLTNLLTGAAVMTVMLATTGTSSEAKTLRLATQAPEGSVWANQIQKLADEVAAADVDLDIEIFWNGQLGGLSETFKQTIMGRTDIWAGTTPFMSSVSPEVGILGVPFMFNHDEQAKCVFPQLEAPMREVIGKKYHLLHLAPVGTQDINAKKPIRTPDDVAGLRVRTAPVEGAIIYYRAAGAVPQPMSPAEAPAALQTGLLDAIDNDATFTILTGMHKLVPYHTPLSSVHVVAGYVVSPRSWAGLSDEQQAALQKAADSLDFASDFDDVEAFDAQLLERAQGEGTTVVEITPEEREQWHALGKQVQPEVIASIRGNTKQVVEAIDAAKAVCK